MRIAVGFLAIATLVWGGEPPPSGGRAILGTVGADNDGGRSATGADDGWRFLQAALRNLAADRGLGVRLDRGARKIIVVLGALDTTDQLPSTADCDIDDDAIEYSCDQLDLEFHFDDKDTVDAVQAVLQRDVAEEFDSPLRSWAVRWVNGADDIERFLKGESVPVDGTSFTVSLGQTAILVLPSHNELFRAVKRGRADGVSIGVSNDLDNYGISDEELQVLRRRDVAVRLARFCVEGQGGLFSLSNGYGWLSKAFTTALSVVEVTPSRGVDHANEADPYSDLLDDQGGNVNFSLDQFNYEQVFRRPGAGDPSRNDFEPILLTDSVSGEAIVAVDFRLENVFETPKLRLSSSSVGLDADQTRAVLLIENDVEFDDEPLDVSGAVSSQPWVTAILRVRAPGDPVPTTAGLTNFAVLELTIDRAALANGSHSATVRITSNGEEGTVFLPVTIQVEKPVIALQSLAVDLGTEASDRISISNDGFRQLVVNGLDVVTDSGDDWLGAELELDTAGGTPVAILLAIDRAGLAAGDYRGTVTIRSNGGTRIMQVSMNVVAKSGGGSMSPVLLLALAVLVGISGWRRT